MKKHIPVFFLLNLFGHFGFAQNNTVVFISRDSIERYNNLGGLWKFKEGDGIGLALAETDDSGWMETRTTLNLNKASTPRFNSVGWFRLHFIADSTIAGRPLAMTMNHLGASEIYLDGTLIKWFGKIASKDSCVYNDPQELPFVFLIKNAGKHVLAVKYTNYDAENNYEVYGRNIAGFRLRMGETWEEIDHKDSRVTILSFVLMMLCGFFISFCLIHFFMYLLNRANKSNLYFSVFILSLATCFIIGFICYTTHSTRLELKGIYLLNSAFIVACISLSGFINELFGKKKLRFKIIFGFGIVFMIARFFNVSIYPLLTLALVIGVSFEAVFTVVFAMIKKVKGAWIIGTGILFFTLFILIVFAIAMTSENSLDIDDSSTGGKLFLLVTILSIISIPVSMSVYLAWNFSSINKNLTLQLEQVKLLSEKAMEHEQEKQRMLENKKEELEKEVWQRTAELRAEKKKSDDLLLNILPEEVADELKEKGSAAAKEFDQVTVLFTDFKGFTEISEKLSPAELVNEINYCFSAFDNIIHKYGIEKIKTIGDSYMCAGGLPVANKTHPEDVVNAAVDICNFMNEYKKEKESNGQTPFEIRIGVHTGPVVAGIVGVKKFAYDIWGDTVNTASRMESSGAVGKINISGATYGFVKDKFRCEFRGKIQAKGKGEVDMYFIG